MKNVGLLVTKNEGAILEEMLEANTRYIKEIYALYGGDDETEEILKKCKEVRFCVHEKDALPELNAGQDNQKDGRPVVKDGIREVLLREIRKDCEVGDWVTLMHGDEIFYHDPNAAAALAAITHHNTVVWFACHFFLTTSDLSQWEQLKEKPLQERVTWYATNEYPWTEARQFQINADVHYDIDRHSTVVPDPDNAKIMPTCPILKHYKVWNPDPDSYEVFYSDKWGKDVSRKIGRWGVVHWEIHSFEDFFVELYPGYSEKHQFVVDFGRFEVPFNTMLERLNKYLKDNRQRLSDIIENAPAN